MIRLSQFDEPRRRSAVATCTAAIRWLASTCGRATRNASLVVLATMALFAVELLAIGFFVYGQVLALPVAIVAGLCLYHRMQRAT